MRKRSRKVNNNHNIIDAGGLVGNSLVRYTYFIFLNVKMVVMDFFFFFFCEKIDVPGSV